MKGFNSELFAKNAQIENIKMIELKFLKVLNQVMENFTSQKNTEEIKNSP